jgi:hypothetical protein
METRRTVRASSAFNRAGVPRDAVVAPDASDTPADAQAWNEAPFKAAGPRAIRRHDGDVGRDCLVGVDQCRYAEPSSDAGVNDA